MADGPLLDAQNPWPGLAAFAEGDHALFRGRAHEADELARLVRRERLTVLFGRSGLGKSSLLGAGLFPRLRQDLHLPVLLRVGYGGPLSPRQQVWQALAAACAAGHVQAPPATPDESLWAYFHRAGAGFWNPRRRPLLPVLVFDQFEEMFTLGQADETHRAAALAFADELADLVEDRPAQALRRQLDADPVRSAAIDFDRRGCKVLLSFREDFLAEMEGLRPRMPSLMRNRFRLLPMDGAQARAVVGAGGDLVSADVGERIIGLAWRNRAEPPTPDEAERIEVDPALLSVICSELNLRRQASSAATIEAGLLAGAEREILVGFYERSLQGLDIGLRHFVEDELITTAGYRDSFAFDDALARPGVSAAALQRLVAGRLLRVDERFGVRRLELTHDVLTRVVMASRDRRRDAEARALAEREATLARQAALLAQHKLRRSRRLAGAMALLALVAIGLLALTVDAYRWATHNVLPPDAMLTLQRFRLGHAPVPDLVAIAAGRFDMGEQDQAFIASEVQAALTKTEFGVPSHQGMVIAAAFALGSTEVTYDQYDYYVWQQQRSGAQALKFPATAADGRGAHPVVFVNWREAMAYAHWLGRRLQRQCRLPTEAEWEYAARAGSTTAYWWGDSVDPARPQARCKTCDARQASQTAAEVAGFAANRFGLHDTAGNVFELTCSAWRDSFDGAEQRCTDQADTQARVIRGGSFGSPSIYLRSSSRADIDPLLRREGIGFRVLCTP